MQNVDDLGQFLTLKCWDCWSAREHCCGHLFSYSFWTIPPNLVVLCFKPADAERFADFYIRTGDSFIPSAFDPMTFQLCHYQPTALGIGETRTFNCPIGIAGRYVSINFPMTKTEPLHICEVEINGKSITVFQVAWERAILPDSFTHHQQHHSYFCYPCLKSLVFCLMFAFTYLELCTSPSSCEYLLLQPWSVVMTPTLLWTNQHTSARKTQLVGVRHTLLSVSIREHCWS